MKLGPARLEAVCRVRDAALVLARTDGEPIEVAGRMLTEVTFDGVTIWVTPWRSELTGLDVWYEGAGGAKVLNMAWLSSGEMEVIPLSG